MRRRDFIAAIGAVAALPQAAPAQQPNRARRVGVLAATGAENERAAFEQSLQKLGWADGRNIRIDYRSAKAEQFSTLARELVGLRPDAILAGGTNAAEALQQATRSIPIVFTQVGDPIGGGLVASFARPGANITGFVTTEPPLAGKWLELLKEAAPQVRRMAFLYNPDTASYAAAFLRYTQDAAAAYAVELTAAPVHNDAEIEIFLEKFAITPNGGLIVLPELFTQSHQERIIALAVVHRLPAIYGNRLYVDAGGLMCYAVDVLDTYRLAAGYVDRILKGDEPADLPVQAPVRFQLIVNLKAAKAIGLMMPEIFLVRADQVIE